MINRFHVRVLICLVLICQGLPAHAGKRRKTNPVEITQDQRNQNEQTPEAAPTGHICFRLTSTGETLHCTRSQWDANLGVTENFISRQFSGSFRNDGSTDLKAIELNVSPEVMKEVILPLFEYGQVAAKKRLAYNALLALRSWNIEVSEDSEWIPGFVILTLGKKEEKAREQRCPEGYVFVAGNPNYSTPFCMMKYPASRGENGRAVSVMGAMPWVSINRDNARAACQANGAGYDLVSNDQRMTANREIEANPKNWNQGNGPVGIGTLSRGNSNSSAALAAGEDENPYFGLPAEQQGNWTNARTHKLSNDEVIWDMAGNVWEWVLDDLVTDRHGWQEFNTAHFAGEPNRSLYAPQGAYHSAHNVGKVYMSNGGAALRGGNWASGRSAGVFAATLDYSPTAPNSVVGFRCAFVLPE